MTSRRRPIDLAARRAHRQLAAAINGGDLGRTIKDHVMVRADLTDLDLVNAIVRGEVQTARQAEGAELVGTVTRCTVVGPAVDGRRLTLLIEIQPPIAVIAGMG